jgi:hypothetical protein
MKKLIRLVVVLSFVIGLSGCKPSKKQNVSKTESGGSGQFQPVKIEGLDRLIKPSNPPEKRIEIALKFKDFDFPVTGDEKAIVKTNKGTFVIQLY